MAQGILIQNGGNNNIKKTLLYKRSSIANVQTVVADLNDNISNYDYVMFVFREKYNSGAIFNATYDTEYLSLSEIKSSAGYIGINPLSITKKSDTQISISATPTGGTWAGQILEIWGLKGSVVVEDSSIIYIIKDGIVNNDLIGSLNVSTTGGSYGERDGYYLVQANYDKGTSITPLNTINLDGYNLFVELHMPSSNQIGAGVRVTINGEQVYYKNVTQEGWTNPSKNHIIVGMKYLLNFPITTFGLYANNNSTLHIFNIWLEKE